MRVILLLLSLVTPAWAGPTVLTTEWGTFDAVTTTTNASQRVCVCDGRRAVVFMYDLTGSSFTANLQQSIDNGTNWTDVSGSSSSTDLAMIGINNPVGCYRFELSAASSASVTMTYRCAAE